MEAKFINDPLEITIIHVKLLFFDKYFSCCSQLKPALGSPPLLFPVKAILKVIFLLRSAEIRGRLQIALLILSKFHLIN